MILYTMMPQELIYPDTTQAELPKQKMMQYNGISMLVEENEYNQQQIVRILSTDPQHYLDKKYYPGQILS
ncbi:YlzJ-like family protein [Priestia flexa]|jgi:precorrin-4 methylase|uniref:Uncharacterized protein n=2 Tax=Priestia TaxID=2800373 RepID=A0A0V8JT05_9BACI|nr:MULTISPECIES: YlzJ-like family protein [Bacillaceae]AQX54103.1 hypothetical protein BC359_07105 [Priestia flexa]KSU89872.1 hypothetical protein AS180_00470 [Priestia veravalensis]KZB93214.1 hypothetical protein A2U94_00915 [Bacillus sp. VT 712]MBN8250028.1 YlzJ-like family protein [Priestia flexa]MBY6084734.1 YlzJ-like family protein [Priestia flexa]